MQKILIIDNYDSFTYNVVHLIHQSFESVCSKKNININFEIIVKLNDKITIDEISQIKPLCIFISPGPCSPNEAGISLDVIKNFYKQIPIFGICLGHQAICQFFGGDIVKVYPFHGKESNILLYNTNHIIENKNEFSLESLSKIKKSILFENIEDNFSVVRYHSLALNPLSQNLSNKLNITSIAKQDGVVMSVEHSLYPIFGVQFHPESILSKNGIDIFNNFFNFILNYSKKL